LFKSRKKIKKLTWEGRKEGRKDEREREKSLSFYA
jgi:hypothetical protein